MDVKSMKVEAMQEVAVGLFLQCTVFRGHCILI